MPGMGRVDSYTLGIAAGSGADWRSVDVKRFWNYDSLFIWVSSDSDSYGRLGYDTGTPYDAYGSSDEVTWTPYSYRWWFRVNFTGETVGDLPVSGTVNTIAVPNLISGKESGLMTVPAGGSSYYQVLGAGAMLIAYFRIYDANAINALRPSILCDGVEAMPFDATMPDWKTYVVNLAHSDIYLSQWDTTGNYYVLAVALPLKFRRMIQVGYKNGSSSAYTGRVSVVCELIG
jgi:hypothetical protein